MSISSQEDVRNHYQDRDTASTYVKVRFQSQLTRLLHERQVAAIQRAIDQTAPRQTLEVAPGPGRITRDIRPHGELTCLEYNQEMIREGRAACGDKANWIQGDAFELPFGQDFDLLYSFRFVRHFQRPDRERLYGEFHRVLKPGSLFILDAVNERVSRPLREADPEGYVVYDELYQEKDLREELQEAGFEIVSLEPVLKRYHWQFKSQVLVGPRADWLNRLMIRGLEWLSRGDGLEWIVTCRRA